MTQCCNFQKKHKKLVENIDHEAVRRKFREIKALLLEIVDHEKKLLRKFNEVILIELARIQEVQVLLATFELALVAAKTALGVDTYPRVVEGEVDEWLYLLHWENPELGLQPIRIGTDRKTNNNLEGTVYSIFFGEWNWQWGRVLMLLRRKYHFII